MTLSSVTRAVLTVAAALAFSIATFMTAVTTFTVVTTFIAIVPTASAQESTVSEEEAARWIREFQESLDYQSGQLSLSAANAKLALDSNFRFLDAGDARRLLEEAWRNPPDESVHGAIVPVGFDPFGSESWAVVIQYEEDGYVSDDDANEIDYEDLLGSMQEQTSAENELRLEHGYPTVNLIGWAEPPHYDPDTHKLYWAKEIAFSEIDENTLNYNIRALSRQGVLVLNAVGTMDQLPLIRAGMQDLLPLISFDEGSRYVDFDPDVDQVAAYGIGALVAGKLAAKAGLLAKFAPLLLVVKKFGIFIVVGIGAFLRSIFGGKGKDAAAEPADPEDSTPIT